MAGLDIWCLGANEGVEELVAIVRVTSLRGPHATIHHSASWGQSTSSVITNVVRTVALGVTTVLGREGD